MTHRDQVFEIIKKLKVATPVEVGEIMAGMKVWTQGQSSRVQAQKHLNALVDLNKLQRGKNFYALPEYRGEYQEHDQLITKCLTQLLCLFPESQVKREISLPVGLRSDAIILLRNGNKGMCVILEVCLNETPEYLNQKIETWKNWEGATETLKEIFKFAVPHFTIAVHGETVCPKEVIPFNQLMERLKNEN